MLELLDGDALAPEDQKSLEAIAKHLPREVPISDAQAEAWLAGLPDEARDWSLTWTDVAKVSTIAALGMAIIFTPVMSLAAAIVVVSVGMAYGAMLRSMTQAMPVTELQ